MSQVCAFASALWLVYALEAFATSRIWGLVCGSLSGFLLFASFAPG